MESKEGAVEAGVIDSPKVSDGESEKNREEAEDHHDGVGRRLGEVAGEFAFKNRPGFHRYREGLELSGDGVGGGDFMEEVVERAVSICFKLGRGAVGDDAALIDDDGAGAGGGDLFEDVSGEEDGAGFAEVFNELTNFELLVRVEAVRRFVEDEDFGIVKEGLCEAGAVAVSLGESADGLASDGLEEAGLDGAFDGAPSLTSAESAHGGTEFEEALDGHVFVERGGFREVTDFLLSALRPL